jgi:hypothetical protein
MRDHYYPSVFSLQPKHLGSYEFYFAFGGSPCFFNCWII